jgi:hypothetical protein
MAMLDPRLASLELLALAARRAQQRQTPQRVERLRVVYEDGLGVEPPLDGPVYRYTEPAAGGWVVAQEEGSNDVAG